MTLTCILEPGENAVRAAFDEIARAYAERWGIACLLVDDEGAVLAGTNACRGHAGCRAARRRAIHEAVRWGEPTLLLCPGSFVIWAAPIMCNARVLGGIVADRVEMAAPGESPRALSPAQVRAAVAHLLRMVEQANLTNAALLDAHRTEARREQERAEAIHAMKGTETVDLHAILRDEEPALIAAIKGGHRPAARQVLNRVLAAIYYAGGDRQELLKSLLLELVVTISRTAVEAGADPSEVMGANYSLFADVALIETEEALCAWLVATLERLMDAIAAHDAYPLGVLLQAAHQHMRDHLHEEIGRDDVAQIACLSPAHFGRVLKQAYGASFTELLTAMRMEKACRLLAYTTKELAQIALECGYCDQSYFTRVFRRTQACTPGEYRKARAAG